MLGVLLVSAPSVVEWIWKWVKYFTLLFLHLCHKWIQLISLLYSYTHILKHKCTLYIISLFSLSGCSITYNVMRKASVERNTGETQISVKLAIDTVMNKQKQVIDVHTGIGFLDHVS